MSRSLLCIAFAATLALGATAAHAEEDQGVHIKLDGDLSAPGAIEKTYSNIQGAARDACETNGVRDLATLSADRDCYDRVVSDAVRQINMPELTRLDARRTGRADKDTQVAGTQVALADRR
jgi:UrcA family protein